MMQTPYTTSTQGPYCHSCGMFHHHNQSCCYNNYYSNSGAGSYSMVFSMPNAGVYEQNGEDYHHPSSVVDCTLSLGTPSTRCWDVDEKRRRSTTSGASSCISNFWDLLHPKNSSNSKPASFSDAPPFSTNKPNHGCSGGVGGGDSLLARRCANCDTTSTPLWRNGPRGPKSLCNACGIRFKKEERRTAALGNAAAGATPMPTDPYGQHHNSGYNTTTGNNNNTTSWAHQTTQRVPCNYPANEIKFMDDYGGGEANNVDTQFLSWRLNVADRASLVHDFIR